MEVSEPGFNLSHARFKPVLTGNPSKTHPIHVPIDLKSHNSRVIRRLNDAFWNDPFDRFMPRMELTSIPRVPLSCAYS
jgi:hypothetical protein